MNTALNNDKAPLPDGWTQKKEGGLTYTFNENGRAVCGAYNHRQGTYDRSYPCKGSNRCKVHGGKMVNGKRRISQP